MLKIVLTGPESIGKTTLARELARTYGTMWSEEFARSYAETKQSSLGPEDVEPIALGQQANEDAAIASARDLVILATELVSTYVYGCYYYGVCPPWIERAARERLGDLYLLPELELPFETDLVRDTAEARIALHERFADTLRTIGAR